MKMKSILNQLKDFLLFIKPIYHQQQNLKTNDLKYSIINLFILIIITTSLFKITSAALLSSNVVNAINDNDESVGVVSDPDLHGIIESKDETAAMMEINRMDFTTPMKGWRCHCWNSTNEFEDELECHCEGEALIRIPQKLHMGMQRLTITRAGLPLLRNTGLKVFSSSLRDIVLSDLEMFEEIQGGSFGDLPHLRTIYISHAPRLTYLAKDVFKDISDSIKTIRIVNSGLIKIPDMMYLSSSTILQMIDLEGNHISRIDSKSVKIKTEQLILDNNELALIDDSAFSGSQIAKLSFKGNMLLQHIHSSAFAGILNIQELDLSSTSLIDLPSNGLQDLEILRVQNTHTLKTIPSIYYFKNLQIAWLTHSFHCCAFKYPSRHDPTRHAQRLKEMEKWQKTCTNDNNNDNDNYRRYKVHTKSIKRKRRWSQGNFLKNFQNHFENKNFESTLQNQTQMPKDGGNSIAINPIRGSPIIHPSVEKKSDSIDFGSNEIDSDSDFGDFHEPSENVQVTNPLDAFCGNWTIKNIDVSCFPIPDALNPCEDVMGSYWLRASVWVVVLLAVIGNVAVLVVILATKSDNSVSKFLMCHLAFADLCMGLYLLLIASIDAHSMGEYFNYAFDWQYGAGCKVAGFLTVFASHLSVFTLTIITLERWFAITHAIYLNKRIKLKPAAYIMIGGWIYSIIMSSFPLFGISNYSSTSICLPMEARDSLDVVYLVSILGINGAAFFVIAICYAQIYLSLGEETRQSRHTSPGEMTVAKKMALLVFTNFSCWAPIAFFGLTAIAGYPLINVTKSKILLVFFYPLNSCADPYLYAILTSQYRRDLYNLLSKLGLCKEKALDYRRSVSLPATNITYPVTGSSYRNSSANTNAIQITEVQHMLQNEDFV